MRFRLSADRSGHVTIDVLLRTDSAPKGQSEEADFRIEAEAAAIDNFVSELSAVQLKVGAAAELRVCPA